MMKKISNWLKKKSAIISIALSNVEKNALSQNNEGLGTDANQTMRINQGKISDSLINGEITEEVMDLRWRTYKILDAADGSSVDFKGYDDNGNPIYDIKRKNLKISDPNIDNFDPYEIEMIVDNTEIVKGVEDALNDTNITLDRYSNITSENNIQGVNYFTQTKNEKPIAVTRNNTPNFFIENFTNVLKIRKINNDQRLLEFYISIYPDEYNRVSRLLISNIKKKMENPLLGGEMFNLKTVGFITNKTQGAYDNLLYEYENLTYDKIVEHNGHYVVKFISDIKINGYSIVENHRRENLDKKYENKEKK